MGGESPRVLWITNTHAESLQSDLIADLRGPATAKPRIVVLGSGESASVGKSEDDLTESRISATLSICFSQDGLR